MLDIVDWFCKVSGQKMNFTKSQVIHFEFIQLEVSQFLFQEKGFFVSQGTFIYFGFPLIKNARCISTLHQIKINIQSKLKSSELEPQSQAGSMVLTKLVILVIPTYYMSCYKFPKKYCESDSSYHGCILE